jgi:hypothetical protein
VFSKLLLAADISDNALLAEKSIGSTRLELASK